VKVAKRFAASYATFPFTGVTAGPVKVKVVELIVEGFIAPLKPAMATVLGQIPVLAFEGAKEITVGAPALHTVFPVVKLQTKLTAIALPSVSMAPVVIVAVYTVFSARLADGLKVAVSLPAA
jgi:hypothetical protein